MSIIYRKHELYPESILIRDFYGIIGVDDIIDSWKFIIENQLLKDSIKGVINNLTGCELSMEISDFERLISFLKKQDYLKGIRLAVICTNPKFIIFPVLGEKNISEVKIKPFSTVDAGVEWILFSPK